MKLAQKIAEIQKEAHPDSGSVWAILPSEEITKFEGASSHAVVRVASWQADE